MKRPDGIEKLPVWAQKYISDLESTKIIAVRALNDYLATQKPSMIFVEDLVCTGEEQGPTLKRHYVQSTKVSVMTKAVRLDVILRDDRMIEMQYSTPEHGSEEVALIPTGMQSLRICAREDMYPRKEWKKTLQKTAK